MRRPAFSIAALCFVAAAEAAPGNGPVVKWIVDGAAPSSLRVEVSGLNQASLDKTGPAHFDRLLQVQILTAAGDAPTDTPAMAGAYRVERGVLVFAPGFPPEPGATYRATVRDGAAPVLSQWSAPARPLAAATVVTEVYPTAMRLPENLLKFYVYFSAPMRGGGIYEYIRLLDEHDQPVELPFLEIDEELWDPTMTRLTLFIDPGRIKRGVQPLEDVGPALVEGKRFRLAIDDRWKDAAGRPLSHGHAKAFEVGPPDRDAPDPTRWKLILPPAGGRNALRVEMFESVDHALARRLIRVVNADGRTVPGIATLEDAERRWVFVPKIDWNAARYTLIVQGTIEDLAGNNVGKPFDVDLEDAGSNDAPHGTERSFEVR